MVNVTGLYDDKDQLLVLSTLLQSNKMMGLIFWVGVVSGLRISDLLKLKIGDIGWGYFMVVEGKTKKEKHITLPDDCFRSLDVYITELKQRGQNDSNLLFKTTRQTVHRHFSNLGIQLGMNFFSPHSMRKTYA
jgi:integrase